MASSYKKSISFYYRDKTGAHTIEKYVDLSQLSYTAMSMADAILTTDPLDDLSHVRLRCKYTNAELYKIYMENAKELLELEYWQNQLNLVLPGGRCEDMGAVKPSILYPWSSISPGESGEEYFEREATKLKNGNGLLLGMVLDKPMSPLRFYRIKNRMSMMQLHELTGMSVDQICKIESGKAKIENITLKNALALAQTLGVSAENLVTVREEDL